jgi:hypothetical protein
MMSTDPRVHGVLRGLAALASAPTLAPTAGFRAELRQQLVGVTPRLVSEGGAGPTDSEAPTAHRTTTAWVRLRRPVTILLSTAAVFVALLGTAVFLSGRALPGDSLYGVKRASENVGLSLSSSDTSRGKQYLSLAGTRADEVSDLLGQAGALGAESGPAAGAAIGAHTAKLITSTLDTQDSQTKSGASLLNTQSLRTASAVPLRDLLKWAPSQQERMQSILARIPPGALHDRAVASLQVLDAATTRSKTLEPLVAAPCQATTSSDEYGPIPVAGCTAPAPSAPATGATNGSSGPAPSRGSPATATTPGGATLPGVPLPTGGLPVPTGGVAVPTGGATVPSIPGQLPSLPSSPVTTGTCGLGVNLPPITIGVGTCGITVGIGH